MNVPDVTRALLVSLVVLGCGSGEAGPSARAATEQVARPSAEPAEARQAAQLPVFAFAKPEPWRSKREGAKAIDPPDLAQETWRVLVSTTQPIQAKTPRWQDLPAERTVELQMPPDTAFRCLVPPLQVTAHANVIGTELKAWSLERRVLCSSDGFHTWTESIHRVRQPISAARAVGDDAGLLLREQDRDGSERQTFVLLRSEAGTHDATTGPPRVLEGVAVEED